MPFTFAHPAIVLPFGKIPERWISMTGLIIGSMVPDFEYFIRMRIKSIYSHTWPGLLWFDLPIGLLSLFIYQFVIKEQIILHLPPSLNDRLSKYRNVNYTGSTFHYLFVAILSILIGAASHIVWDGFTHPDGYFVSVLPVLSNTIQFGSHQLLIYKIIQHGSTVTGLVITFAVIYSLPRRNNKTNNRNVLSYWLQIISIAVLTIIVRFLTGLSYHHYGDVIVTGIAGVCIGLIITSLISKFRST